MRDLQKALEEDYRPRSTARGEKAMTEVEHRLFYRVIAGAKSHINVDWRSKPDETWFDELSEALADINDGLWYVHKPEGKQGGKSERAGPATQAASAQQPSGD